MVAGPVLLELGDLRQVGGVNQQQARSRSSHRSHDDQQDEKGIADEFPPDWSGSAADSVPMGGSSTSRFMDVGWFQHSIEGWDSVAARVRIGLLRTLLPGYLSCRRSCTREKCSKLGTDGSCQRFMVIHVLHLGLTPYGTALQLQRTLMELRKADTDREHVAPAGASPCDYPRAQR